MVCLQAALIKAAVPWLWASHIPSPTAQPSEELAVIKKSQP